MQGKIFFSLNTFQISDLWFSNCEGEKWKRGRYWGRKLAYLVILHDVWPVPTNGWILLPPLMRLQVCQPPPAQPDLPTAQQGAESPPHRQPYPHDFTSLCQISKGNYSQSSLENTSRGYWAWDNDSKMPAMGWVGDRPPALPNAGPHRHGWRHPTNPTLEQDEAMFTMEVGKNEFLYCN